MLQVERRLSINPKATLKPQPGKNSCSIFGLPCLLANSIHGAMKLGLLRVSMQIMPLIVLFEPFPLDRKLKQLWDPVIATQTCIINIPIICYS